MKESIVELSTWLDEYEFEIKQYENSQKQIIPLIKEWKDLMTIVSGH